jgi:hypothetical protein
MTNSEMCALCGSKLREGSTDLVLKAGEELVVIKRFQLLCAVAVAKRM